MLEFTVTVPQHAATVVVSRPGSQGPQGIPGPRGLPGDGVPVVGEALTGVKDGVNRVFTSASSFRAGTVALYLNGLRESHFTETGSNQITLEDPPTVGDSLRIDYVI